MLVFSLLGPYIPRAMHTEGKSNPAFTKNTIPTFSISLTTIQTLNSLLL